MVVDLSKRSPGHCITGTTSMTVCNATEPFSDTVKNLGVYLDKELKMSDEIHYVCKLPTYSSDVSVLFAIFLTLPQQQQQQLQQQQQQHNNNNNNNNNNKNIINFCLKQQQQQSHFSCPFSPRLHTVILS